MNKKNNRQRSVIISSLVRFSEYVYKMLPSSFTARLLVGSGSSKDSGLFSTLISKLKFRKRVSLPIKRYLAKAFDGSIILKYLKKSVSYIPFIQMKSVGLFCLSFGIYSSMINLIEQNMGITSSVGNLAFAAITAAAGAIFSLSKKNCYEAVSDSRILSPLIFDVIGVKRPDEEAIKERPVGRGAVFLILGIVGGLIGTFTSPLAVLSAIPILIVSIGVLMTPEIGVSILLFAIPFVSAAALCRFSLLIFISWFFKFVRGKRLMKFDSVFMVSAFFAIMILLGGVISVSPSEGIKEAKAMISIMLGCFASLNLIKTSQTVKHCTRALTLSFSLLLITVLTGNALRLITPQGAQTLSRVIGSGASALFRYNSLFGYMAIAALPIILLSTFNKKNADAKITVTTAMALTFAIMIFASARSTALGLILSLTVLLLLISRRSLSYIVPSLIVIPLVISLLPQSLSNGVTRMFELDSLSLRYEAMGSIDRIIYDSFSGGIGLGSGAFERIYPLYSVTPYESAMSANSLYAYIQISLGFSGILVFAMLIAAIIRKYFLYAAYSAGDDLFLKNTAASIFSSIASLLTVGAITNVWKGTHAFLLFWMMLTLFSATVRIASEERYTEQPSGPTLELDALTIKELSRRKDKDYE